MSNDKITKTNDGYVVEIFAKTKKEIGKEILDTAEGVSILDIDKNKTEEEHIEISEEEVKEELKKMCDMYNITEDELLKEFGSTEALKYELRLRKAIEVLKENN